jgi:hypothetical protein
MNEPAPLASRGVGFDRRAAAEPEAPSVTFREATVRVAARNPGQLARCHDAGKVRPSALRPAHPSA